MKHLLYTFAIIIFSFFLSKKTTAQCHIDDWTALKALYESTDGDNWYENRGWELIKTDLPQVGCDLRDLLGVELNANGRVNSLNLIANNLIGSLPSELGNLSDLMILYLSNNYLSGGIPLQLGQLSSLTELGLSFNQLTGSIPSELGSLEELIRLGLKANQLSGEIPVAIGNLSSLQELGLGGNQLNGNIPVEFFNLTNLTALGLGRNELTGEISVLFGSLTNLEGLGLDGNNFSGNIPSELSNLTNLSFLYLHNNNLAGNIPTALGNLGSLNEIILNNNQLIGNIPANFCNLTNLTTLKIANNNLSGCYDNCLLMLCDQLSQSNFDGFIINNNTNISNGNNFDVSWESFCYYQTCELVETDNCHIEDWRALKALYESTDGDNWRNNTGWEVVKESNLPANCNLNNLNGVGLDPTGRVNDLRLLGNQLNGNIPSNLSNLSNLINLNLGFNQLYGTIPADLVNLTNLTDLWLLNNELTGTIPEDIGNLTQLNSLVLISNKLTGEIPSTICKLTGITDLSLSINELTGSIPDGIYKLSNLILLLLDSNKLQGGISSEIGELANLESLMLQDNNLKGKIPESIGQLSSLVGLNLSNNKLSDSIPTELGNLTNLDNLNLSGNRLSGYIPEELGNLNNLTSLRLNDNKLNGVVPALNFGIPFYYFPSELNISNNYFLCSDIDINFYNHQQVDNIFYRPQNFTPLNYDDIKTQVFDTVIINRQLLLSMQLPFENTSDFTYQWKRNGNTIEDANQATYTVNDIRPNTVGKYTLHIESQNCLPDENSFESISDPIYVVLRGYDLFGEPVQYNQLVVAFDNAEETQQYENDVLLPNVGIKQKGCNCNRELYLWQFPSTEAAIKALLEIDQKTQTTKITNKPKGGFNNLISIGDTSNTSIAYNVLSDKFNASYPDSASIFILDSGLDEQNYNASPFLYNQASVDVCYGIEATSGYSYIDTTITVTTDYTDDLWHGTFGFRSITENLNSNLKLVPLKIFDEGGNGALFDMICALYHAIDHNADVVNISAGFKGQPSGELEKAIDLARRRGIFVVAAAGNDSLNIDDTPQYPAYYASQYYKFEIFPGIYDSVRYDNVISVASINTNNNLSPFSNYGEQSATLACYGENIHSYGLQGNDVVASGSSMATYYASKALALEITKDRQRDYQQIWNDFEIEWMVPNSNLSNVTRTGKQINFDIEVAAIEGCTDPKNCNYFPFATTDDGSCLLPFINLVDSIDQSATQYHANDSIVSNSIINSVGNKTYKAGDFISLENGFEVEVGAEFFAEIKPCD